MKLAVRWLSSIREERGILGSACPSPLPWKAKIVRILETRTKGSYLDYGGKEPVGGRVG